MYIVLVLILILALWHCVYLSKGMKTLIPNFFICLKKILLTLLR